MPPNLRIGLVQSIPNQPFYAGSPITGSLLLDIYEPKSYKEILIHFSGRSYVHWTGYHTVNGGRGERFTSSEGYVDLAASLWSKLRSPDGKLHPGQYNWPFSFNIPPTAPSSFEGTVGDIRYTLVGTIVTGMLKSDHTVELQVPVEQLVRITDPRLLQPVRQEVQKRICCLCCASGPIVMTVAVPKTGFCIGEAFQLHASLENGSNRRLTMNARITQRVVYHAQGRQQYSANIILSIRSEDIEPQASRNWEPTITIPTTHVDIFHEASCRNINVSYTLHVMCQVPFSFDLARVIPIQLGNYQDQQMQVPTFQPGLP